MTPEQLKRGKEIELHIANLKQRFSVFKDQKKYPIRSIQIDAYPCHTCLKDIGDNAKPDYMLTGQRAEKYKFLRDMFLEKLEQLYLAELAELEKEFTNL